jgi:hypothetical protein
MNKEQWTMVLFVEGTTTNNNSSIVVDRLIRRDTENEKKRDPNFWRGYRRMTDDIIAHFHARLQT